MDQVLIGLLKPSAEQPGKKSDSGTIKILDDLTGEIEITNTSGAFRHTLKPLAELYGQGHGVSSVDPSDLRFMPLLMSIEQKIVDYYKVHPELTDGHVSLTLDRMSLNPAVEFEPGELGRHIQINLRLTLSSHDYSKREVMQAVRKIAKSVDRHSRVAGITGYLDFIRGQLSRSK